MEQPSNSGRAAAKSWRLGRHGVRGLFSRVSGMLPPGPVGGGLFSPRTIRPVVAISLLAKGTLHGTSELVAAVPGKGGPSGVFVASLFGSPVKIVSNLSRGKILQSTHQP